MDPSVASSTRRGAGRSGTRASRGHGLSKHEPEDTIHDNGESS